MSARRRLTGSVAAAILVLFSRQVAAVDYWVFFTHKLSPTGERVRWDRGNADGDAGDWPVDPASIRSVLDTGAKLRIKSRWFNAVTVRATPDQLLRLRRLAVVERAQAVAKFRRAPTVPTVPFDARPTQVDPSFEQRSQIGVTALHEMGFRGSGVRIAILDNGFHYSDHPAFEHLRANGLVVAARDFVNGDDVVTDEMDQLVTGNETVSQQNIHGAQVLSVLAGNDPGRLVGVAPEAEYLLAKTEDNGSELPVEEDRWIAGLEWADSLGADVVNSSLGYTVWDDGRGYSYADLDGQTTLTSQAAALAAARGIVVVVAAGNEGNTAWRHITAPADAPGILSVGAVDQSLRLASFSSVGPTADGRIKPDLVAPGVQVVVADIRRGDYQRKNGTSFAAPLVSGVGALLVQARPDWTASEVLQALRDSAVDLGEAEADTLYGWGLVSALRASGFGGGLPEAVVARDPFPNPVTGSMATFAVDLPDREMVVLRIFDLVGRLVHERRVQLMAGADQRMHWTIPDDLANGIYLYEVSTSESVDTGKLALVR